MTRSGGGYGLNRTTNPSCDTVVAFAMPEHKIRIAAANTTKDSCQRNRLMEMDQDTWARLRGDDDFRNMDAAKIRHWLAVVVAEILGTAILVGLGCSSLHGEIPEVGASHATHLNIILTFGFAVTTVVTTFCHISGSHVNPAISLASLMHGQISIPAYFLYVVSQCIGSTLGIAAVKLISPDVCTFENFCVTLPTASVGPVRAAICEAFMAGILTMVVCAAWDSRCHDKHDSMPIKFGLAVFAIALPGGKYSGASINPARSFGPALMAGNFSQHWVYWVGPLTGAFLAVVIYKAFLAETNAPKRVPTKSDDEENHPL